jgi:hypothetical protein
MKIKMKFYLFLCLPWVIVNTLLAQEVVTSSGGYAATSGGKLTWTIGEPVTETISGTNATLTQGFNQGKLLITVIKNPENTGLTFKVYPNPANDYLRLSVGEEETGNLKYFLIDMGGKMLFERNLFGTETDISIGTLPASVYLLKVYQNNKEIGVYKIIKK